MSAQRILIGLGFLFLIRGGVHGQTTVEGLIENDTVWEAKDGPFIMTGMLYVGGEATLTIEAGVEVHVQNGLSLVVGAPETGGGTLIVNGRRSKPVLFTARDQTEPGSWGGLWFRELAVPATFDEETGAYLSGGLLQHAILEYAGAQTGSITLRSTPFIHDCVIRRGAGSGVFAVFNNNQAFRFMNNRIEDHETALEGAGLRIVGGRDHVLQGNVFAGNTALKRGGGVYLSSSGPITATGNTFEGNQTSGAGGGVYVVTSGPAEVKNNLFSGNQIVEGGMNAHGAGMFIQGSAIQVSENRFIGNRLQGRDNLYGGGLYIQGKDNHVQANFFEDNLAEGGGGGLGVFTPAVAWVTGNTFLRNGSAGSGGAVYIKSSNETQFVGNLVEGNEAALVGGGVYIQSADKSILIGNTLRGNRSLASGGGAYLSGGVGYLESNVFDGNRGGRFGGGIYFRQEADGVTEFTGNTIIRNTVNNGGGGVYVQSHRLVAADIRFVPPNHVMNNRSNFNGGGLYVNSQGVTLAGGPESFNFIINNSAKQGSGIYNALSFDEGGAGDVDARLSCWGGSDDGLVPDQIYDYFDNPGVGMVLFEPTAPCCLGEEQVEAARCEAKTNRNVLKLILREGTPGNIIFADLSTGETALGAFDETGKGKVKFKGVNGPGSATLTSGCGTVFKVDYDCPE